MYDAASPGARRHEFAHGETFDSGFGGNVQKEDLPWGRSLRERERRFARQLSQLQQNDPNFVGIVPLEDRKVGTHPALMSDHSLHTSFPLPLFAAAWIQAGMADPGMPLGGIRAQLRITSLPAHMSQKGRTSQHGAV